MAGYLSDKEKEEIMATNNYRYYEKYRNSKRVKGTSEKSLITYYSYFMIFLKFLHYHKFYKDIDLYSEEFFENAVDILEEFMGYLQTEYGNHKKTINTKLSAISSFYLWSVKRKIVKHHPFDKQLDRMKNANQEKIRKAQWLTQEQVDLVIKELFTNPKYDLQDQVLFSLVLDSGNRVGAIHQLTLSKLDLENMVFTDIVEKGNKMVDVVFENEDTRDLIAEWIEYRKENLDKLSVDSLFITYYEGTYRAMGYGSIQERFSAYGKDILGLERFGMHDGRKTKANLLYEETGDITASQDWLNHNDPTTTMMYIKPKSKTDLRDSVKEKRALKSKQLAEIEKDKEAKLATEE